MVTNQFYSQERKIGKQIDMIIKYRLYQYTGYLITNMSIENDNKNEYDRLLLLKYFTTIHKVSR